MCASRSGGDPRPLSYTRSAAQTTKLFYDRLGRKGIELRNLTLLLNPTLANWSGSM
jgi:hypothetical protein